MFYENGVKKELYTTINHNLVGKHYFYYENGKPWKVCVPDSRENYPPTPINFWLPDGTQTLINGNGFCNEIWSREEYKDGLLHGTVIQYFWKSEIIRETTEYTNGKRNGMNVHYYQNENLKTELEYIEDHPIWEIHYPEINTLEGHWKFTIAPVTDVDSQNSFTCLNLPKIEQLLQKPIKTQWDNTKTCVGIMVFVILNIATNGDVKEIAKHNYNGDNAKLIDEFLDRAVIKQMKFAPRLTNNQAVEYQVYVGIDYLPKTN